MLVHVQMPGATFVAPPHRWLKKWRRRIKPGGQALVILQPTGPVRLVFDVSDTEPEAGAPPLPRAVERPFEVRRGHVDLELEQTVGNARRDGVKIHYVKAGSQAAGCIGIADSKERLEYVVKEQPERESIWVPVRYELLLNSGFTREEAYASLVHELGHLYCGHLGTPHPEWWPDRRGLSPDVCEFEAESVCYLVCTRLGIENPSEEYLARYLRTKNETPSISLDCVMKAGGLIEHMGRQRLKLRREKGDESPSPSTPLRPTASAGPRLTPSELGEREGEGRPAARPGVGEPPPGRGGGPSTPPAPAEPEGPRSQGLSAPAPSTGDPELDRLIGELKATVADVDDPTKVSRR